MVGWSKFTEPPQNLHRTWKEAGPQKEKDSPKHHVAGVMLVWKGINSNCLSPLACATSKLSRSKWQTYREIKIIKNIYIILYIYIYIFIHMRIVHTVLESQPQLFTGEGAPPKAALRLPRTGQGLGTCDWPSTYKIRKQCQRDIVIAPS